MRFETISIPVGTLPDGRKVISDTQCAQFPEIMDFVKRFPNYWVRDINLDAWVSPTIEISSSPRLK